MNIPEESQNHFFAHEHIDASLLMVFFSLLSLGTVMVYSASIGMYSGSNPGGLHNLHHLVRHLFAVLLGCGAAFLSFSIHLQQWQNASKWLFFFGIILLGIVLIPGLGKIVYGARRWVSFVIISIQPSELMKLFVILYAADYTVRKQDSMKDFSRGFLPIASAVALVGLLLLLEPDMGAFLVIAVIAMGLLFIGGVNSHLFTGLVITASTTFSVLVWLSPWRRQRIFAYLAPFDQANSLGKGYQLTHSLIAFGRGEFFGVGLGRSIEKLHYLPEAHTDFLLAVIGEELGLIGVVLVLCLFSWMIYRIFQIGNRAVQLERTFNGLVAQGIGIWIAFQTFINTGANMGLLPTKGLTLPFMSYGGTGMLLNCMAMGIILRIDHENRQLTKIIHT